jgi:hypothetical protein
MLWLEAISPGTTVLHPRPGCTPRQCPVAEAPIPVFGPASTLL